MKHVIAFALFLSAILSLAGATRARVGPPALGDDSYTSFAGALGPYGEWVELAGRRGWRPDPAQVGPDFVPYQSHGAWVTTDYGWSFETGYPWGWAAFHYGRWWNAPDVGWVWFPGADWGSSWCEWRSGGGYVGWRPLPPVGFGVAPAFVFVEERRLVEQDSIRYAVPSALVPKVVVATQPVSTQYANGSVRWYAGPSRHEVALAVGRSLVAAPMTARPPAPGTVLRGPIIQAQRGTTRGPGIGGSGAPAH